jgi:hypothetical protein
MMNPPKPLFQASWRNCNLSKATQLCTLALSSRIKHQRGPYRSLFSGFASFCVCFFFFFPLFAERSFSFQRVIMADDEEPAPRKVRYTLEPVTDLLELNTVVDTVERFIQPEHGKVLKVVVIEKVVNNVLEERYLVRQSEMIGYSPSTTKLKFHGTSSRALHKILNHGFRIPENPGMYGRGVYFATDSSKSAQYSTDQTKILLCEVALGKSMIVSTADHSLDFESVSALGFDSVYAPRNTKATSGVLFDEFVVYNKDQAIPRYCVTYTEEKLHPEDSSLPYSDEPLTQESLPEGPVRWKKSAKSSRWSERYAYILHGQFISLFKNAQQCKAAVSAIHSDRPSQYDPDVQIDVSSIDTMDVKEEQGIKILILSLRDGNRELLAIEAAYEWMRTILSLRLQLKNYAQAVIDLADKDSDDESTSSKAASSNTPMDPAMAEYEARKAARKAKVGMRVDVRQMQARAVKEQVAVYDEISGNYLGQLNNDEAIFMLPNDKVKLALHKGMLALKTDKSWKILHCVVEGSSFVGYRAIPSENGKKLTFEENKRIPLDFAKIIRSSFTFGKKVVPAFMVVVDNKPSLFCGKAIPEWIDIIQRFSGEGTKAAAAMPLISEKELKRWAK